MNTSLKNLQIPNRLEKKRKTRFEPLPFCYATSSTLLKKRSTVPNCVNDAKKERSFIKLRMLPNFAFHKYLIVLSSLREQRTESRRTILLLPPQLIINSNMHALCYVFSGHFSKGSIFLRLLCKLEKEKRRGGGGSGTVLMKLRASRVGCMRQQMCINCLL